MPRHQPSPALLSRSDHLPRSQLRAPNWSTARRAHQFFLCIIDNPWRINPICSIFAGETLGFTIFVGSPGYLYHTWCRHRAEWYIDSNVCAKTSINLNLYPYDFSWRVEFSQLIDPQLKVQLGVDQLQESLPMDNRLLTSWPLHGLAGRCSSTEISNWVLDTPWTLLDT